MNGVELPDLSSDEEDHDWEDIDLSLKKQVSLDDLTDSKEIQDLEVTLERTQLSMRIKFHPSVRDLTLEIKHLVLRKRKSECMLISFMYNVSLFMALSGMYG
jgi:hypothetical protein